ncbi:MAG: decaprenyl-phosphate phosphoribosyltransferase [Bacteroidetes bacterium]|nr:decaprenyl-phosphate phosphoribosyltransferase [Bacteroidota bacterium]
MQKIAATKGNAAALANAGAIRDRIRLMRPAHWLKNVFVFAPLVFGKVLTDSSRVLLSLETFVAFCLVSSAVYIVNDIADRTADAEHPVKRLRPIASGRIGVRAAAVEAGVLLVASGLMVAMLPWQTALCISVYAALNAAYSFGLKHVVIVDVFIIAGGFMLRVLAGAKAVSVEASEWLMICTMFLALFLAIAKRRSELNHIGRGESRKVLDDYTPELVRLILNVSVMGAIVSYTLYTVSDHAHRFFNTNKLIYTVPFVMYGIFRYLYLDEKQQTAENPVSIVLRDPWLVATGLAWMVVSILIIYIAH